MEYRMIIPANVKPITTPTFPEHCVNPELLTHTRIKCTYQFQTSTTVIPIVAVLLCSQ